MKAVYITEPGGLANLVYGERPEPAIGPGEVLIRVKASAAEVRPQAGGRAPMPLILGGDAAGVVEDVGSDVGTVRTGQRVLLNPAVSCGHCEYCLSGDHGTCRQRCRLGTELDGGYAEFVKVPAENVHEIPDSLTFEEAAAIPVAFFTAWHLLITRAQLRAGETVMVTGAGGSVGSAAMQIAKWAGARAFAAVGSERKLERAKQLGADGGVNYGTDDLSAGIRRLTGGRGVDVIADTVGASVWEHNLASLAVGGRLVVCGFRGGGDVRLNVSQLIGPRLNILGSGPLGSKVEVKKVMEAVWRGEFHGIVDRTLPLEEAPLAHKVIESRDFFGKLILLP